MAWWAPLRSIEIRTGDSVTPKVSGTGAARELMFIKERR
jgi:hypothetical protein